MVIVQLSPPKRPKHTMRRGNSNKYLKPPFTRFQEPEFVKDTPIDRGFLPQTPVKPFVCVCVGWKWFILARKCIEFGYSWHIQRLQNILKEFHYRSFGWCSEILWFRECQGSGWLGPEVVLLLKTIGCVLVIPNEMVMLTLQQKFIELYTDSDLHRSLGGPIIHYSFWIAKNSNEFIPKLQDEPPRHTQNTNTNTPLNHHPSKLLGDFSPSCHGFLFHHQDTPNPVKRLPLRHAQRCCFFQSRSHDPQSSPCVSCVRKGNPNP